MAPGARQSRANLPSPTQGGDGFPIYTPLAAPLRNFRTTASSAEPGYTSDFTALQLLRVMSRLTQPDARSLSYFMLCREFGVRAVDGMVRGRILDLRWMDPVTKEGPDSPDGVVPQIRYSRTEGRTVSRPAILGLNPGASQSGTAIPADMDLVESPINMEPGDRPLPEDDEFAFGPKVLAATPILHYAMAAVVAEYEDTRSVSEYASLSDVDEY